MEKAEFFATCCSKRTVLTVEKHWEIKNPFFTCCHLLHYCILLRYRTHKLPVTTILSLLKSPFNEGFSYFNFFSYIALVVGRKTSAFPMLLPASYLFSCFYINECCVLPLPQLKCFSLVIVETFCIFIIDFPSLWIFFKAQNTFVLSLCSVIFHSSYFPGQYFT